MISPTELVRGLKVHATTQALPSCANRTRHISIQAKLVPSARGIGAAHPSATRHHLPERKQHLRFGRQAFSRLFETEFVAARSDPPSAAWRERGNLLPGPAPAPLRPTALPQPPP